MFSIILAMRQSPSLLQFQFKDFISANKFRDALRAARAREADADAEPGDDWCKDLRDDYGRTFDVLLEEIGALMMIDMTESTKGGIDMRLLDMRAQLELQQKIQSDPKFRFAQSSQLPPGGLVS